MSEKKHRRKNPRYVGVVSTYQWISPVDDIIEWGPWGKMAVEELMEATGEGTKARLNNEGFSRQSKIKIREALDLLERFNFQRENEHNIPFETMRQEVKDLKKESRKNEEISSQRALEYICLLTSGPDLAKLPLHKRAAVVLGLMKDSPWKMCLGSPGGDAMACKLVQDAFTESGFVATVRHTRPTKHAEGEEPVSVFEQFIFSHVLIEHQSDSAGRKVLSRRLKEAEKAISANK